VSTKDPAWEEFVEYVRERPPVIQDLMRQWPPGAIVKTVPGVTLLIPAPGIEGTVNSYFEDGSLGIVAPTSIPHPEHGWGRDEDGTPLEPGTLVAAAVDPAMLRLIREERWTKADIEEALRA
jgi:hypothetical protein